MSTDELPRIIGLTGGIASGKSTVSRMLAELGACIIDADVIAREVVAPGSEGLAAIRETFGEDFVRTDGTLDREKMGALVFTDHEARQALNMITHPRIGARMMELAMAAAKEGHRWVIYDAALLVENGLHRALAGTIVVSATPETQLARIIARDGLSREEAQSRIDAQLPLADKVAVADWVIHNDGSLEDTRREVAALFDELNQAEQ